MRPAEAPAPLVQSGDLTYRVIRSGPASATEPPIVLVHGIGMSHRSLALLHEVLAEDRTVLSVDLPGHGGLPKPGRDVGIAEMAAGLDDVLQQVGVARAVLVGHSMGAQWVIEAALQNPGLAASVVAIGPVTDDAHRSFSAQAAALALDSLQETPLVNTIVFTDYVRCGIPWYLVQLRHMLRYPTEERVGVLAAPLLVVRGERDPIAGLDWCRRLRDRAPDGMLAQIPGHRHVAVRTAPRAVASAILAHVAGRMSAGDVLS